MRVLVVHNYYRSANASGENLSVRDEIDGLRALGWDVEVLSADSDVIDEEEAVSLARVALRPIHSTRSVARTAESIERFRPHVALIENVFPLHSPGVIRTLRRHGVPTAAGVRSYRMWCVASTMFRDGRYCNECVGSFGNLPAIRHGCYQDSALRSVPMAVSLAAHRSTFRAIDTFLPVSEHVRDELVAAGISPERIVVRPNFVDDPRDRHDDVPGGGDGGTSPGSGFLFAGRLSPEKGVELMVEAWKQSGVGATERLDIAGSGELKAFIDGQDPQHQIRALGLLPHDELMSLVASCGAVVVPSVWPEPFGRSVIEASAHSRPALVAASGGLAGLVVDGESGWVADTTVDAFAEGFRRASDPAARLRAGRAARERFETHYTREISLAVLDDTLTRLAEHGGAVT